MVRTTEIRRVLQEKGYRVQRRQFLDSQIVNSGGYIAGEINRSEGKVFLNYAPNGDNYQFQAVMDLYDLCRKEGLPHIVSGISQRQTSLRGGIEFQQRLLVRLNKQVRQYSKR